MKSLYENLSEIRDFRRKEGKRYPLEVVLMITIMAIICGYNKYREFAKFAKANEKFFVKYFKLKIGRVPSHVTFRTILKGVDFDEVLNCFHNWSNQYVKIEKNEWFAIDGKALCSTVTESNSKYQNFVSLVSIFSHKKGQVLKVAKLETKKSSEIPTVRKLIEYLDLKEVNFTIDALHCQKKQ